MQRILFITMILISAGYLTGCGSSSSGGSKGTAIQITTEEIPAGQIGSNYTVMFEASGGSGEYSFTGADLPAGLTLSTDGEITGEIEVESSGDYTFDIRVTDLNYDTNYLDAVFTLTVVDFLPDEYEPDNDFPETSKADDAEINIIYPGDMEQEHTIHENSDIDYAIIDMSDVDSGDVILMKTEYLRFATDTNILLYGPDKELITSSNDTGLDKSTDTYASLLFQCESPDIYYLKVEEWAGNVGDYILSVSNTKTPLEITTETLSVAVVGDTYIEKVEASGGTDDFTFSCSNLPTGLIINEAGNISGRATASAGEYTVTIKATDNSFSVKTVEKDFYLTVIDPLEITTETLPDAKKNEDYSTTVTATGGSGNYVFSAYNLPSALSISTSGEITGSPTVDSGNYTFRAVVTDSSYSTISTNQDIELTIVDFLPDTYETDDDFTTTNIMTPGDDPQEHTFHDSFDPDFIKVNLGASGISEGDVIIFETSLLSQPTDTEMTFYDNESAMITADGNSGDGNYSKIIFTVTETDIYYIRVLSKTSDSSNVRETGDYKISITNTGIPLTITTETLPNATKNESYSATVSASGDSGGCLFTATGLPDGLTISNGGVISGTPTANSGEYTIHVIIESTDHLLNSATADIILNIVDFSPDAYETDNNFLNSSTITPPSTTLCSVVQEHTIHSSIDEDYIKIDLSDVAVNEIVYFRTTQLTVATDTIMTIYDESYNLISSNDNRTDDDKYSAVSLQLSNPCIYYVKIEVGDEGSGDYTFTVTLTGQPIEITTSAFYVTIDESFSEKIQVTGGSGDYSYGYYETFNEIPQGLTFNEETGVLSGVVTSDQGTQTIFFVVANKDPYKPNIGFGLIPIIFSD